MYGLTLHVSEVMEKIRAGKKGTQVLVMNEDRSKLQPIIGRKGAAFAKVRIEEKAVIIFF